MPEINFYQEDQTDFNPFLLAEYNLFTETGSLTPYKSYGEVLQSGRAIGAIPAKIQRLVRQEVKEEELETFKNTIEENQWRISYQREEHLPPDKQESVGTILFEIRIEKPTLEKFLIQNMQWIPEVESIYKLSEGDEITIYTIISNKRYNRVVNMQVYEVEYNAMEAYPEANIDFHCLPRLGFTNQEFIPSEAMKIYERIP